MGIKHDLAPLQGGEVQALPGLGEHQEAPRHFLCKEADGKGLQHGGARSNREDAAGCHFTLQRASTFRSDAGCAGYLLLFGPD